MQIVESYDKSYLARARRFAKRELASGCLKELPLASSGMRMFYDTEVNDEYSYFRIFGFSMDLKEFIFQVVFDRNEALYGLGRKDKLDVCVHFNVDPKYQRNKIITKVLDLYRGMGCRFFFQTITREGIAFMNAYYSGIGKQLIAYSKNHKPIKRHYQHTAYLGES